MALRLKQVNVISAVSILVPKTETGFFFFLIKSEVLPPAKIKLVTLGHKPTYHFFPIRKLLHQEPTFPVFSNTKKHQLSLD